MKADLRRGENRLLCSHIHTHPFFIFLLPPLGQTQSGAKGEAKQCSLRDSLVLIWKGVPSGGLREKFTLLPLLGVFILNTALRGSV